MSAGQAPRSSRQRLALIAIGWLLGILIGFPVLILIVRLAIFIATGH